MLGRFLKNLMLVWISVLLWGIPSAEAKLFQRFGMSQRPQSLVGTIQRFSRNSVEILDERDHRVKTFVFVYSRGELKEGDAVRIYYFPETGLIETIKKMTPVEYKREGQNKGYLLKND